MKRLLLFAMLALLTGSVGAAEAKVNDEVLAAAKKLGDKANYSWKATVVVPESAQFKPGPIEGKTEKDGCTHVSMTFGDNTWQVVMKGDQAAATNQEGQWLSVSELENEEGRGRFMARMVRSMQTPAKQAAEFVAAVKELKRDGDAYAGTMTEEGAKAQFRWGNVTNPKGAVKFWIKDGLLTKMEFKIEGKVEFNNNEMEIDRTTTIEIKDVGTTKVTVPEDAKKKLG